MAPSPDDYSYSRSSSFSAARSPDTASSIYPERAIRPLPKSRLKSRLSPEQASAIVYPPTIQPLSPTLNFGASTNGQSDAHINGDSDHQYHQHEAALIHDHCTCSHTDGDSGDDEVEFDHPDYRYTSMIGSVGERAQQGRDTVHRRLMDVAHLSGNGKPLNSNASSADGYESFENTSNKKKRKIPLSNVSSSIHQSKLSAELANMGISYSARAVEEEAVEHAANGVQAAHTSNHDVSVSSHRSAGTGISGAGRGRYGRREVKDGRRPLASTAVNNAGGYAGRQSAFAVANGKHIDVHGDRSNVQTPGIISRAIRTAAESTPLTHQKENVSLLHQTTNLPTSSPKTQFTFTCESDSGNKMLEQPTADPYRERQASSSQQHNRQGDPTLNDGSMHQAARPMHASANMAQHQGQQANYAGQYTHPNDPQMPGQADQASHPPPNQRLPRPRRSPSKEYAFAARQRKLQQQYSNYHHKPRREDMWICQFCEYEDIFGVPPVALIRAYEIKDRQERKKAAEKRRLLEKAKQRGRKGKKGAGKNNKSQGVAPSAPMQDPAYNGAPLDGDDYFDDEDGYADDYDPVGPDGEEDDYDAGEYYPPPPPPVPLGTPPDLRMAHAMHSAKKAAAAG